MLDFADCGRQVLAHLHQRLGFDLWLITRAQGEQLVVLQAAGQGAQDGDSSPWTDSLCQRMVDGALPRIAPDLQALGVQTDFGAYVGFPLRQPCGALFGTLCGFAAQAQPRPSALDEQLLGLQADLLSALLQRELSLGEARRAAERADLAAQSDALTGLLNRGAWDRLLAAEEARCRRLGHAAAVAVIDLDGLKQANDTQGHAAGDRLLQAAARALRAAARSADLVARLGGDEFALLAVEYGDAPERLQQRIAQALADAGVAGSIGVALRLPRDGLNAAQQAADALMYADKRARRAGRNAATEPLPLSSSMTP